MPLVRRLSWRTVALGGAVLVLGTIVALVSSRRRSAAAETVRQMKDCACAGDTACFFAHVDRGALLHFAIDTLRSRHPSPPFQPLVMPTDSNVVPSWEAVEPEARKKLDLLLADWEKDIVRAKEGTLCRMRVIEPSSPDAFLINVSLPTGRRTWLLSLLKDGPVVVGLTDE